MGGADRDLLQPQMGGCGFNCLIDATPFQLVYRLQVDKVQPKLQNRTPRPPWAPILTVDGIHLCFEMLTTIQ